MRNNPTPERPMYIGVRTKYPFATQLYSDLDPMAQRTKAKPDNFDLSTDREFKRDFSKAVAKKWTWIRKEYESFRDSSSQAMTLHRYFIWAERMRFHFERSLLIDDDPGLASKRHLEEPHSFINGFMFMSLWYALLYAVIEAWGVLKLHDKKVDRLLVSGYVSDLRDYRNSTLHFSKGIYFEERFEKLLLDRKALKWITDLHFELGRAILANLRNKRGDGYQLRKAR